MPHFHRWFTIPKWRRHSHMSSVYLAMLEQDRDIAVQTLTTECQRLIKLKQDTEMIQQEPFKSSVSSRVISMEKSPTKRKNHQHPVGHVGTGTTLIFVHLKNTRVNSVHVVGTKIDKNNTTIMNMAPSRGKTHHKKTGHFRKSTSNSIFATFNVNFEARRKYIVALLNKRLVKFQFDTTSDITLISRSTWELLGKPTLKDTTHVACSALGNKIQLTGKLIYDVSFKKKKKIFRYMLHYRLIKPEPSFELHF